MSLSKLVSAKSLLILICLFFLLTRLYKITGIPVSVYWDEASIGYNAYSISETGKDEWGEFLPLHFRAFGEFKLPVYIYAVVPFVKIFGLNAFSVRLPAVIFSLGAVVLTYFLAKKVSGRESTGLFSSFFVSISPWFFIFSRTGYEATAGLMFYLLGIYLFLEINKTRWFILLSSISFILSAYSYNSFRITIPLTILILLIYNINNLKSIVKQAGISLLLSLVIIFFSVIPIYRLYVFDAGFSRLLAVGATKTSLVTNYLSHFNFEFLIFHGDQNLRSQQAGFGQLYLPDLILLPFGLFYLFYSRSKYNLLILILMLLGPIPAAITKESPHALRAISSVPFISIISAMGLTHLWKFVKKKYLLNFVFAIIFLGSFLNYFLNFLNVYPAQSSKDWQSGYKKIYTDYGNQFDKYDHIFISDEYAQPYIFALFYRRIDPYKFRREVVRNSVDQWGFSTVKSFDKFIFNKIKLDNIPAGKNLIFASSGEKLSEIPVKGELLNLDGSIAFHIYEYNK